VRSRAGSIKGGWGRPALHDGDVFEVWNIPARAGPTSPKRTIVMALSRFRFELTCRSEG
jgi:hypothetical protein